jgi:hypothetical protein
MYPREMNSLQDVQIGQERENGLSRILPFLDRLVRPLIAGRSAVFVTLRMPKRDRTFCDWPRCTRHRSRLPNSFRNCAYWGSR